MSMKIKNGMDFASVGQILNLPDPTVAQNAATKNYVDGHTRCIARNTKTANITGITTNTVELTTTATLLSGHSYQVHAEGEAYIDTSTGTSQHELRYTTNGTAVTTSSTLLDRSVINHSVTGNPDLLYVEGLYDATSAITFKVGLCCQRVSGSGTANIQAAATFPLKIMVEDLGTTVSNTA